MRSGNMGLMSRGGNFIGNARYSDCMDKGADLWCSIYGRIFLDKVYLRCLHKATPSGLDKRRQREF